jgi:hypothetical protein
MSSLSSFPRQYGPSSSVFCRNPSAPSPESLILPGRCVLSLRSLYPSISSLYGTTQRRVLRIARQSSSTSLDWVRTTPLYPLVADSPLAYTPSKFRLLSLDIFIVFLQMVLATIAYETSFAKDNDNATDAVLSVPDASSITVPGRPKSYPTPRASTPFVIDLRFRAVIARLRNPLPPPPSGNGDLDGLPLPNTTPWPLPAMGLRMLLGVPPARPGREASETGEGDRRIPGALE